MTNQPVDTSDFRSALRDDEDKLERLTRVIDERSKELEDVKEQLHVIQLIVEDQRCKLFDRKEQIKQL